MKFHLTGFLLLVGLAPLDAHVISLQPQAQAAIHGNFLEATISVVNRGDEAASAVQIQSEALGISQQSSVKSSLDPGERFTTHLQFPVGSLLPGRYPLITRVLYADANGYPFSALVLSPFFAKKDVRPGLWGTLGRIQITQQGATELRIKAVDPQLRKFHVRLCLPRELSAEPQALDEDLKAGGETAIPVSIKNLSALQGSTYPIFAVIEYEQKGTHFTAAAPGLVQILPSGISLFRNPLVAAFALVLALIVGLNLRSSWLKQATHRKRR